MELFVHNYPQLIFHKKSKLKLFCLKKIEVPLRTHKNRSPPSISYQHNHMCYVNYGMVFSVTTLQYCLFHNNWTLYYIITETQYRRFFQHSKHVAFNTWLWPIYGWSVVVIPNIIAI